MQPVFEQRERERDKTRDNIFSIVKDILVFLDAKVFVQNIWGNSWKQYEVILSKNAYVINNQMGIKYLNK